MKVILALPIFLMPPSLKRKELPLSSSSDSNLIVIFPNVEDNVEASHGGERRNE